MTNKLANFLGGVVILMFIVVVSGVVGRYENAFETTAQVINIEGDEVTIVDSTENIFTFYGDGYEVGQNLVVSFDTKGTNKRSDDVIIAAVAR